MLPCSSCDAVKSMSDLVGVTAAPFLTVSVETIPFFGVSGEETVFLGVSGTVPLDAFAVEAFVAVSTLGSNEN